MSVRQQPIGFLLRSGTELNDSLKCAVPPDLNKEPNPVIRLGLRLLNGYAMISSSKLIHESDDN